MKKIILYSLLIAIFSAFFIGCKKYPDGPSLSLLSRKARLSNTWHLSKYYENGVDKTADFNAIFQNAVITIAKDGSYSLKYKAFGVTDYSETGTWRFTDDDAYFETNPTNGTGSVAQHRILRLKDKELWYEDSDANGLKEYHLIP